MSGTDYFRHSNFELPCLCLSWKGAARQDRGGETELLQYEHDHLDLKDYPSISEIAVDFVCTDTHIIIQK